MVTDCPQKVGIIPENMNVSIPGDNRTSVCLVSASVVMTNILKKDSVVAETAGVGGISIDGPLVHLLSPVAIIPDCPQEVGIIPEAVGVDRSDADDLFVHLLNPIIVATNLIDAVIDEVDVTAKTADIGETGIN